MTKNKAYKYPATKLLDLFEPNQTAAEIGQHFKVHRKVIQNWRAGKTYLDQWSADKYAIKIGKHPSEIWHNWFDEVELAS